jgi:hypothetical protein
MRRPPRSHVYVWSPQGTLFDDITAIERSLCLWAETVSDWEILITLKQTSASTGTSKISTKSQATVPTSVIQKQAQLVPPTYTVTYKDMDCVATAVKVKEALSLEDVTVAAIEPGATVAGVPLSSVTTQYKMTQWKCHGRKYLFDKLSGLRSLYVFIGTIDRGQANMQPVLEVVHCGDTDEDEHKGVVEVDKFSTVSRSYTEAVDHMIDVVAYDLIPRVCHLTIYKPASRVDSKTLDLVNSCGGEESRTSMDSLIQNLKERTLKWISIATQPQSTASLLQG